MEFDGNQQIFKDIDQEDSMALKQIYYKAGQKIL